MTESGVETVWKMHGLTIEMKIKRRKVAITNFAVTSLMIIRQFCYIMVVIVTSLDERSPSKCRSQSELE